MAYRQAVARWALRRRNRKRPRTPRLLTPRLAPPLGRRPHNQHLPADPAMLILTPRRRTAVTAQHRVPRVEVTMEPDPDPVLAEVRTDGVAAVVDGEGRPARANRANVPIPMMLGTATVPIREVAHRATALVGQTDIGTVTTPMPRVGPPGVDPTRVAIGRSRAAAATTRASAATLATPRNFPSPSAKVVPLPRTPRSASCAAPK